MSSISSASSSTSDFTCDRFRMRCFCRSISRPASPDDDVDALLQGVNLRFVRPYRRRSPGRGRQLACRLLAMSRRPACTVHGSARSPAPAVSRATVEFFEQGIPKASVLPVPVLACPITSWPSRARRKAELLNAEGG